MVINTDQTQCPEAKPDLEAVRRWLIGYQHDEVLRRYADIENGEQFRELFDKYMYPTYDRWDSYKTRNELFRWVANVFKSGKLDILLGAARIFLGRFVDALKSEKNIPHYLDNVIESYDISQRLDELMIVHIHSVAQTFDDLNEETYREAYCKFSTWEDRLKQINNLVESGEYAKSIIERGGVMDAVIEHVPRIPIMTRNRFINAINETLAMVKAAYRAFKSSNNRIDYIRDAIVEHEISYVERFLGPRPEYSKGKGKE